MRMQLLYSPPAQIASHNSVKNLDFASSVTSVPYHPGAAKYFSEKGKNVAAVKSGAGAGSSRALSFGTGGDTGTYYAFGGVLSSYVSNNTGVTRLPFPKVCCVRMQLLYSLPAKIASYNSTKIHINRVHRCNSENSASFPSFRTQQTFGKGRRYHEKESICTGLGDGHGPVSGRLRR